MTAGGRTRSGQVYLAGTSPRLQGNAETGLMQGSIMMGNARHGMVMLKSGMTMETVKLLLGSVGWALEPMPELNTVYEEVFQPYPSSTTVAALAGQGTLLHFRDGILIGFEPLA